MVVVLFAVCCGGVAVLVVCCSGAVDWKSWYMDKDFTRHPA